MITLENVSKFVISDFSIHIPTGECVGLIGVSGAGKTTLLRLISGLLAADSGYARTMGKNPVLEKGMYGREISIFLAGKSHLESDDTVRENLEMQGCVYRISKAEFSKEYEALSQRFDFASYKDKKVKELSLGQRMRVELAAALLVKTRLMPFSSIYFTPVQIYLGQLSGKEMIEKCVIQIVWILIIYCIGDILWKCGQRKLVVQGG